MEENFYRELLAGRNCVAVFQKPYDSGTDGCISLPCLWNWQMTYTIFACITPLIFLFPRFCFKKIHSITITCVYSKIAVQSAACYRSGDEAVLWHLHRNAIPGASVLFLNGGKGKEVGKWLFPSSMFLLTKWSSSLFRSSELILSCAIKHRIVLSAEAEKREDQGRTTDRGSHSKIWGSLKHLWSSRLSSNDMTQYQSCATQVYVILVVF